MYCSKVIDIHWLNSQYLLSFQRRSNCPYFQNRFCWYGWVSKAAGINSSTPFWILWCFLPSQSTLQIHTESWFSKQNLVPHRCAIGISNHCPSTPSGVHLPVPQNIKGVQRFCFLKHCRRLSQGIFVDIALLKTWAHCHLSFSYPRRWRTSINLLQISKSLETDLNNVRLWVNKYCSPHANNVS